MALRKQQIPSPNDRQAEAATASPSMVSSSDSERRRATPVESGASRELRELSVVKKATADKMLDHIARRAKGGKVVNFSDEEMDGPFNELGRYGLHAAFRYWPPTLLIRWGVDACLFAVSVVLALMKDICCTDTLSEKEEPQRVDIEVVFSQYVEGDDDDGQRTTTKEEDEADNGSPSKRKSKGGSPSKRKSEEDGDGADTSLDNGSPSKKKSTDEDGESSPREHNVEDLQEDSFAGNETGNFEDFENVFENTYVGWIMNGLGAAFSTGMRFCCGLIMPFVTIMTLLLYRMSNKLHEWAGISQYEAPWERKDREDLFARLLRFEEIEKIILEDNFETCKTREWLFDAVVDRQVGCLRKYFVFKPLLDVFDVYHPVKIAEKAAAKLSEIKKNKTASLVKYLKEDPDYNEETDPDYKPPADEAPDDSLEYKEDEELDPETNDEVDDATIPN